MATSGWLESCSETAMGRGIPCALGALLVALGTGCAKGKHAAEPVHTRTVATPAPLHDADSLGDAASSVSTGAAKLPVPVLSKYCRDLLLKLASDDNNERDDAARSFFRACDRRALSEYPDAAPLLRRSIELRDIGAAAILLLGSFNDPASREALDALRADDLNVKLDLSSIPVSRAVPAVIARAQQGGADTREELAKLIAAPEPASREFVLATLFAIDDRSALRGVLAYLHDGSATRVGSMLHGEAQRRRIADAALDALAERLALRPTFPLRPNSRYSAEELLEFERTARAALAK